VHTEEMMLRLRDALVDLWQEFGISLYQDVPKLIAQATERQQKQKAAAAGGQLKQVVVESPLKDLPPRREPTIFAQDAEAFNIKEQVQAL